jgi:hypothetical protein
MNKVSHALQKSSWQQCWQQQQQHKQNLQQRLPSAMLLEHI